MYVKYIDLFHESFNEYNNIENKIDLNKVNVFIGKNNSGKSRLMRKLLISEYNKEYYVNENVDDFAELRNKINELLNFTNDYANEKFNETYLSKEIFRDKIYRNIVDEEKLGLFICNLIYYEKHSEIYSKLQNLKIVKTPYGFNRDSNFPQNIGHRTLKEEICKLYIKVIEQIQKLCPETIYFPSSLSLRKLNNIELNKEADYHYGLSTMYYNDYFKELKNFENKIKTGQEVYNDMKRQLLGLNKDREQFLNYEKYVSHNFFNDEEISIFIKDSDNNIYIKQASEPEYPIYLLGDGLQTLIIITYYLFMNNDQPIKIFIDEPEIHLHPGLQRLLILKLNEYHNCQFFISTHSSNLIDICDEYDYNTAIICVDKIDEKKYVYNSVYDNMNLHELLGTRPSSIILSNCTIWVEGPTDIYYINPFLKLYSKINNKKNFILGYNYNFAFNGSINIASKIDFYNDVSATMKIKKLSRNNFVIFDSDNMTEENMNYQKILNLKEKLGNSCYVIEELKTIENIIPPEFLHDYFEKNYNPIKKELKPLVLSFFRNLECIYGSNKYYQMDFPDAMAEYINKKIQPRDIKKYRKYCKDLWKSNKYNLALYFSDIIENMSVEEKEKIFNKIMTNFITMIEEIYTFIEKNNS